MPTTNESQGKPLIARDDPVAKAALVDGLVNDARTAVGGAGQNSLTKDCGLSGLSVWSKSITKGRSLVRSTHQRWQALAT
jgi:hypothetical protein